MKIKNDILIEANNNDIVDGEFTIPNGVKSIGQWAFEGCDSLTSVIISEGVTEIGMYAFYNCRNLVRLVIPDSVKSIGVAAFYGCIQLKSKPSSYKAFDLRNGGLYCLKKKYKEGVKHSVLGELKLNKNGIHYCTNLFEVFDYYSGEIDEDFAVFEIEVGDQVLSSEDDSTCCTNSCRLKKRLSREEIIKILNGEKV